MAANIEQFIPQLEETMNVPSGTIHETDRLEDLEGWDSIAVISVMAMIEYTYGATVDPGAMAQCQTVGDLLRLVQATPTES